MDDKMSRIELMEAMSEAMEEVETVTKVTNKYPKYKEEVKEILSPTGSKRMNDGKPAMSNLLPEFLLGMAEIMTQGEKKYGKNNWKKGNYTSVPYDSAMRHILKWQAGDSIDQESGNHHLFHAAVNLMMCWYYEQEYSEMDDRPEELKK